MKEHSALDLPQDVQDDMANAMSALCAAYNRLCTHVPNGNPVDGYFETIFKPKDDAFAYKITIEGVQMGAKN